MSYVSSLAIDIQTLKIFRKEVRRKRKLASNEVMKIELLNEIYSRVDWDRNWRNTDLVFVSSVEDGRIVGRDLGGWLVSSRLLYQGWRNRNALHYSLTARVARSNRVEKRGHDDRFAGNNSGLLLRACLKVWSRSRQRMGRRNTTKRWLGQKGVEVRLGVPSGWKLAYLDGRLEILADKRYSLASDR